MTRREMARVIARGIFAVGHENWQDDKVQRIEFRGGHYPDNETSLGGLCEDALTSVLERLLTQVGAVSASAEPK